MITYSEKLLRYFFQPKFAGTIDNADSIGDVGDIFCGDYLKIWIKIDDGVISDIKFKCFGCPAAIATSEALCELALNKSVEDACKITDEAVADHLFGLPPEKFHCSNLGSSALKIAIDSYNKKTNKVWNE